MRQAVVYDTGTGEASKMTADEFSAMLQGDSRPKENFDLISPNRGVPVVFRKEHTRRGNEEYVSACFACAAGYGPQDHVFKHKNTSLCDALDAGKKVLLSLNADLSYRPLNFREMPNAEGKKCEEWYQENHNQYVSVSVRSAEEAVKAFRFIHEHNPQTGVKRTSVLYRGGVLPYRDFYKGHRPEKLSSLFGKLSQGLAGVAIGESRVVGFPRLFRFIPAKSTVNDMGIRGLKGNFLKENANTNFITQLTLSDEKLKSSPAYKTLRESICLGLNPGAYKEKHPGAYVLASPFVSRHPEDDGGVGSNGIRWHWMGWVINDPAKQIFPVGKMPAYQEELAI